MRHFLSLRRLVVDWGAEGVLPANPTCTVTSGIVSPTLIFGVPSDIVGGIQLCPSRVFRVAVWDKPRGPLVKRVLFPGKNRFFKGPWGPLVSCVYATSLCSKRPQVVG